MNDTINLLLDNIDTIVNAVVACLQIVGGCAVISAILPKGLKTLDTAKVSANLKTFRVLVNTLVNIYNTLMSAINLTGFNFGKAKNQTKGAEKND